MYFSISKNYNSGIFTNLYQANSHTLLVKYADFRKDWSQTSAGDVGFLPAVWGWRPPSGGGLGAIMGVWLSPFSAGSVVLWSNLDSEGTSLPASTCHTQAHRLMRTFQDHLVETLLRGSGCDSPNTSPEAHWIFISRSSWPFLRNL